MSAEVVGLDGNPAGDAEPEVVKALEEVLADAKAGKITAIAITSLGRETDREHPYIYNKWVGACRAPGELVGAVCLLQHAVTLWAREEG